MWYNIIMTTWILVLCFWGPWGGISNVCKITDTPYQETPTLYDNSYDCFMESFRLDPSTIIGSKTGITCRPYTKPGNIS